MFLLSYVLQIRRLKEHVLLQLPPKRRQIINLVLKKSDIDFAKGVLVGDKASASNGIEEESLDKSEGLLSIQ